MEFLVGYFGAGFLIAFLIVHFGMKKSYEKKHGVPMSNGQVAIRTIVIGLVLLGLMVLGSFS